MENSSDKENKSEVQFAEIRNESTDSSLPDQSIINLSDEKTQEDESNEGWQEAVPKGRSPTSRKSSRRPSLAKLNTNFMNVSQLPRFRGKPSNFTSPRTSPNDSAASSGPSIPVPKKFIKSASFSPKQNNSSATAGGSEKSINPKSAPATPASTDQNSKSAPVASSVSVQVAGRLFSYKEVALAPPGTIVKAVAEQLPKENLPIEPSHQLSQKTATSEDIVGGVTELKDAEKENVKNPEGERKPHSSYERKDPINAEPETEGNSEMMEPPEEKKSVHADHIEKEAVVLENKTANIEVTNGAVLGPENLDTSKESNATSPKSGVLETRDLENCLPVSHDPEPLSVLSENAALLLEKDTSAPSEKLTDENSQDLFKECTTDKPVTIEGEKQDESESGKETTKKLSAAAPPFNPSTVPVFGSVTVPGFKDHGGILPPPVNIPPMLTVNPVRRSPHQSATARVPYGPRLSGGYNRSGNRVPRNKPTFHSGEHNGDGNHFSPPRIMNPHAAEFVPGQPWVPNGYPLSPNGYLANPNGMPVSPNGFSMSPTGIPVSPNGFPASLNGTAAAENGFPATPVNSVETPTLVPIDIGAENKGEAGGETSAENSLAENQPSEQKYHDKPDEIVCPETEEKPTSTVPLSGETAMAKETYNSVLIEEKPSKCWADYSDSEAEIVEVTS